MDYNSILKCSTMELLKWLSDNFIKEIPIEINTIEDMEEASRNLAILSNNYLYLSAFDSYAKAFSRDLKRSGLKADYEDMVDKREAIQNFANAIKQQYAAVSRAVTIRIENNNELNMNTEGCIRQRN